MYFIILFIILLLILLGFYFRSRNQDNSLLQLPEGRNPPPSGCGDNAQVINTGCTYFDQGNFYLTKYQKLYICQDGTLKIGCEYSCNDTTKNCSSYGSFPAEGTTFKIGITFINDQIYYLGVDNQPQLDNKQVLALSVDPVGIEFTSGPNNTILYNSYKLSRLNDASNLLVLRTDSFAMMVDYNCGLLYTDDKKFGFGLSKLDNTSNYYLSLFPYSGTCEQSFVWIITPTA